MAADAFADALAEANQQWQTGRYGPAIAAYAALAKGYPRRPEAIIPAVRAYLGVGDVRQALSLCADALRAGVASPDLLLIGALGRLEQQPDITISVLERLVREFPAWDQPRIGLFHLAEDRLSRLQPKPAFPASAIEQSYADSAKWLKQTAGTVPWVAFPVQVMERALARMQPEGLVIECGVYFGRSLSYIADRTKLAIHGFDSFAGLPEAWLDKPAGAYSTNGLIPDLAPHVELHQGWFEDTLPGFAERHGNQRIALLHLDCDLYSSTATALKHLGPLCDADTVYVFDDLIGIRDWREHEFRALEEYAGTRGAMIHLEAVAVSAREVAVRIA